MANEVKLLLGEYDIASIPELKSELSRLTPSQAATVDLAYVTYMDSACLGLIAGTGDRFDDAGGGLHLVNVPPRIRLLFEVCGLQKYLH